MSPASYAYAVARAFDPAGVANLRGVDAATVHLLQHRDIVAVVSALQPASATESALRTRLEIPEQLEALARAYHAIVQAVAARNATLPLRLATVYSEDARVVDFLQRQYPTFDAALDRLAGRVEVGVKVYLDCPVVPAAHQRASALSEASSPGRAYLRQRREERQRHEDVWRSASSAALDLDRALTELSIDRRHHRLQDARLSVGRGQNVLNAAYLVDARCMDRLIERARQAGAETPGLRVEVTGPWAPYSFTEPSASAGHTRELREGRP